MSRLDCAEAAELVIRRTAERLDAEREAALEAHLENCPACRETATGQRAVCEALEGWRAPQVSPDFDRRLYARIDQPVSWWDRFLRPWRPALVRSGLPVAAAAGLALIAGIVLDRTATAPRPPVNPYVQVEPVRPEQAQSVLEDMELLHEFNGLVRPDSAESRM